MLLRLLRARSNWQAGCTRRQPVKSRQLIPNRYSIVGHASGNPRDSQVSNSSDWGHFVTVGNEKTQGQSPPHRALQLVVVVQVLPRLSCSSIR